LHAKCSVKLFFDAQDFVSSLASGHPRPAEKHLLIELRAMQGLISTGDVVHNRAARFHELSQKCINRDMDGCVRLLYAVNEIASYLPSCPILLQHNPGTSNPSDAFAKAVDVKCLVSSYMHIF
jgi:hypothetical protein